VRRWCRDFGRYLFFGAAVVSGLTNTYVWGLGRNESSPVSDMASGKTFAMNEHGAIYYITPTLGHAFYACAALSAAFVILGTLSHWVGKGDGSPE